jgi:hypothetical protein
MRKKTKIITPSQKMYGNRADMVNFGKCVMREWQIEKILSKIFCNLRKIHFVVTTVFTLDV